MSLCLVVADATGRIKKYSAKSLHRNHVLTLVWVETCHQATGMIGGKTRPRLLHVRYKRIQM